jgi:TetR/AcrR family transcriptional repressor of nem operon
MARKLEFDRTRALEAAMKIFWSRGYVATSLAELLDAMNIARSSFYATFGDKRSLFIECLNLFASRTLELLHTSGIEAAPEQSATAFFEKTLFDVPLKRTHHGCMMVNTILELADVDLELSQRAGQKLALIEQRFEQLFASALEQGRLAATHSPQALAQYVMNINQGLRVQSRKRAPRSELRTIVDTSLSMAGLAA